ncbi:hypothetical protein ABK040_009224 [Willaertia magna]
MLNNDNAITSNSNNHDGDDGNTYYINIANELPREVLIEICDYLNNLKDAFSLAFTCKHYYNNLFIRFKHPIFYSLEAETLINEMKKYYLKKRKIISWDSFKDISFAKKMKQYEQNGLNDIYSIIDRSVENINSNDNEELNNQAKYELLISKISKFLQNYVSVYYGDDVVEVLQTKVLPFIDFNNLKFKKNENLNISAHLQRQAIMFELKDNLKSSKFIFSARFVYKKSNCIYFVGSKDIDGGNATLRKYLNLQLTSINNNFENNEEFNILQRKYYYNICNELQIIFRNIATNNVFIRHFNKDIFPMLLEDNKIKLNRLELLINDKQLFTKYEQKFKEIIEKNTVTFDKSMNEKMDCEMDYIKNKYSHLSAEERLTDKLLFSFLISCFVNSDDQIIVVFKEQELYKDDLSFSDTNFYEMTYFGQVCNCHANFVQIDSDSDDDSDSD